MFASLVILAAAGGARVQAQGSDDPESAKNLAEKLYSADDPLAEASNLSGAEIRAVLRYLRGSFVSDQEITETIGAVRRTAKWAQNNPASWRNRLEAARAAANTSASTSTTALNPSDSQGAYSQTGASCRNHIQVGEMRNSHNEHTWSYTSKTYWCWNGLTISSDPDSSVSVSIANGALGWSFLGHTVLEDHGGDGASFHSDAAIGKFRHCFLFIFCKTVSASAFKYHYGNGDEDGTASPTCRKVKTPNGPRTKCQ